METDYWHKFLKTGSVRDYMAYRKSITNNIQTGEKNEQPDIYSDRDSIKRDKDKRK